MPTNSVNSQQIWIDKNKLANTKVMERVIDPEGLLSGEVVLKIESFGFSANNITYALLGDKMGYWGFFQAGEGFGIVPVWGFATVMHSHCQGIEVGERVFGYLPMASHWIVRPAKVSPHGFFDTHPARQSISPVYDNYLRCAQDPGYKQNQEAVQMNIRPLFMTSFVLDDYVGEQIDSALENIMLTSASSKTAYGTAHLLQKHKVQRQTNYQVIGLTSEANKTFTEHLGCYDQVFTYAEMHKLASQSNTWLLDFAGNKPLLLELQRRFAAHLVKTLFIGATDVQAQQDKPHGIINGELFFAPAQVKKRSQEWGQQGFAQQYATAWQSFLSLIETTLTVQEYAGAEAMQAVYLQGLQGLLDNKHMNMLRF